MKYYFKLLIVIFLWSSLQSSAQASQVQKAITQNIPKLNGEQIRTKNTIILTSADQKNNQMNNKSLKLISMQNIKDKQAGLSEPSDLAFSSISESLWTVSDHTKVIFNLNLNGDINFQNSFLLDLYDLEGISIDESAEVLYATREVSNEIIAINLNRKNIIGRYPIKDLIGFEEISHYFSNKHINKGLEGITINNHTGDIFVLKEGKPGLLIQLSPDLRRIKEARVLNKKSGFISEKVSTKKLDFSGLSFNKLDNKFWIVSDKGQCIFVYNWEMDVVENIFPLSYLDGNITKRVLKAEGIALDPIAHRIYVVSEKDAILYTFSMPN